MNVDICGEEYLEIKDAFEIHDGTSLATGYAMSLTLSLYVYVATAVTKLKRWGLGVHATVAHKSTRP